MNIKPKEYLNAKRIDYKESGNELILACVFGCDNDSRPGERHLYMCSETGQYHCKKCDSKLNADTNGLYVLEVIGKNNIHRFQSLLGKFKIPHYILYDQDQGPIAFNVNELIKDSANQYTIEIKHIPSNLDNFLGIKLLADENKKHIKPAIILHEYKNNTMDQEKLNAFIALVETLLKEKSNDKNKPTNKEASDLSIA